VPVPISCQQRTALRQVFHFVDACFGAPVLRGALRPITGRG
jgi:hypothetical protein